MDFTLQFRIEHGASKVFSLLSDPRQRPRWQTSLSAVEVLDDGEPRLGMRWRERPYGLAPVSLAISAFERDVLWAERFESALARGSLTLRFKPAGPDFTDLELHAVVQLRGPAALASMLAEPLLKREIRRDLDGVNAVLRG